MTGGSQPVGELNQETGLRELGVLKDRAEIATEGVLGGREQKWSSSENAGQ